MYYSFTKLHAFQCCSGLFYIDLVPYRQLPFTSTVMCGITPQATETCFRERIEMRYASQWKCLSISSSWITLCIFLELSLTHQLPLLAFSNWSFPPSIPTSSFRLIITPQDHSSKCYGMALKNGPFPLWQKQHLCQGWGGGGDQVVDLGCITASASASALHTYSTLP